ncbi:MAG: lipopolysaccharide biosynthesis protein [Muribaculaceae bacterium]|nr:lipopolysaccharide biosynthesis protein [Muribaculaceae bacterium]
MMPEQGSLKGAVARTLKWNVIDKVATQMLYAVTGVVLANLLTDEEFGLVGAIMVFQAFAQLFVDSGFASALLQRKAPTRLDYSTILWFNMGMAVAIYVMLFLAAPFIASLFQGDLRIIPMSRVLFVSFIINAAAIVQTNLLMKRMDVRMVAVSNSAGLIAGAAVGIGLALAGFGAWAIVGQTIALACVRTSVLWLTSTWRPLWSFSWRVLKSFFGVGSGVFITSLLNTVFQNIYSFLIGNRASLAALGYFTQADKWSKMGVMSLSQVLTSSFLPLLAQVQDEPERYRRICGKTHRFTAYLTIPALTLLAVMAAPIFHTLFGSKWDISIPLFRILCVRGIFTVLSLLYSNYILSLGRSRLLVVSEAVRDGAAIIAIILTIGHLSRGIEGLEVFLWGQFAASAITWAVSLAMSVHVTGRGIGPFLTDLVPYCALTLAAIVPCWWVSGMGLHPFAECVAMAAAFCAVYIGGNLILGSTVQREVMGYLVRRRRG